MRGYELPFNPQDPGVKKVGSYNVINGPELTNGIRGSNASLSSGTSNGPPKPPRSNSGSTVDRRGGSFRERNDSAGGYTSGGERLESYRTITTSEFTHLFFVTIFTVVTSSIVFKNCLKSIFFLTMNFIIMLRLKSV